ncbi:hypothetical protein HDV00_000558, partial [Rhizophlyctis rosea]
MGRVDEEEDWKAAEHRRHKERKRRKAEEENARKDAKEARKVRNEYQLRLEEFRTRQRKADEIREGLRPRNTKASGVASTISGIQADVVEPLKTMHSAIGEVPVGSAKADDELLIKLERNLSRLSLRGAPTAERLRDIEKLLERAEEVWLAARTQTDEATEAPVWSKPSPSRNREMSEIQKRIDDLRSTISEKEGAEKQRRKEDLALLKRLADSCLTEEAEAQLVLSAWEERCSKLKRTLREKSEGCARLACKQADHGLRVAVAEEGGRQIQAHIFTLESRRAPDHVFTELRNGVELAESKRSSLQQQQISLQEELSAHVRSLEVQEEDLEQCRARVKGRGESTARLTAEVTLLKRALAELANDLSARANGWRIQVEAKYEITQLWKNALANANDASAKSKTVTQRKGAFRQLCRRDHLSFLQTRFDENLAFLNGGNWDPRLSCQLTENFQFTRRSGETTAFSQRSSGERQRTIIALLFTITEALISHGTMQPMLLIIDEVTSFLDQNGSRGVFRFLKEFTNRHPAHKVVVITHADDPPPSVGTINVSADGPSRLRMYRAVTRDGR